jgi:cytoskeletal protein CcmA (bactofilin family)
MFATKKDDFTPRYDKVDTLIAKGTIIRGNVEADGNIRIEGCIEGEINTSGDVVLVESGKVIGNINSANAHISGKIEGNVKAKSQVHLTSSSVVDADMEVSSLVVDEGAVFTGRCVMGNRKSTKTDDYELKSENQLTEI